MFYLSKRNITGAVRNPRGITALFLISIFQSFLMCTIFEGVGTHRLWDIETEVKKISKLKIKARKARAIELVTRNIQITKDYQGFIFFAVTDQFISIAIS